MAHEHPATPADQVLLNGCYKLLETIGEGSYAKVKLAEHLPTGAHVAIKIVNLKTHVSLHRFLTREVECMKALQHPNIVQLYEAIETKEFFFLVMEYLGGGSMMDHLTAHGPMTEREVCVSFRQLLSAVYYLHQRGIAHRDLKPENTLFDQKRNVKIMDFGFSTECMDSKLNTLCGTPAYAAPELFQGELYEGPAVDAWSLGVTLYRMVAGTLPFDTENGMELAQQVTKAEYTAPYFFSCELESLLKKMLKVNPMERSDLLDIMSHPWLSQDEEDLIPYSEPVSDNIDPWVRTEMALLGFRYDDIRDTLANRTFNNTMATYLILQTKKPKFHHRIIRVKPYNPTEQSPAPDREEQPGTSALPPVEQYDDDELGQRGKKPAAPPALQKAGAINPESSQELSTVSSSTISEVSMGTPGSSDITPGSSPETGTPTSSSILDVSPPATESGHGGGTMALSQATRVVALRPPLRTPTAPAAPAAAPPAAAHQGKTTSDIGGCLGGVATASQGSATGCRKIGCSGTTKSSPFSYTNILYVNVNLKRKHY